MKQKKKTIQKAKKTLLWLLLPTLLAFTWLGINTWAAMGSRPTDREKQRFAESSQYVPREEKFENRIPRLYDRVTQRMDFWEGLKDFFSVQHGTPDGALPELEPDMDSFLAVSSAIKLIWLGHSTFLVQLNEKVILIDPVFGSHASPVPFLIGKRFQDPVLTLEELPRIDYIVISHDHYDHLEMKSIKFFKKSNVQFLVPLGVGGHLRGWGIEAQRILEMDWWESVTLEGITFIATPSQHFSGRAFAPQETLWASWVIQTDEHRIYFSGDSGYDTHFKKIGERYGPFDIAFLETGQYAEEWREVHLMPDEFVKAYQDLGEAQFFPIHWGMFQLATHSWYDPIVRLYAAHLRGEINLVSPKFG
ncbi:MAG: MBL fold metallo-hydrolase, partial [Okeania sp. SIO1H5]|uniref:MBL fold metallo-hydrolase n=1 Tax=Okeania sp. SIO1H5 TaxID=2607777 RepID=UPI0013B9D932